MKKTIYKDIEKLDIEKLIKRAMQGDLSTVEELCSYWNTNKPGHIKATGFTIIPTAKHPYVISTSSYLVEKHKKSILTIKTQHTHCEIHILFFMDSPIKTKDGVIKYRRTVKNKKFVPGDEFWFFRNEKDFYERKDIEQLLSFNNFMFDKFYYHGYLDLLKWEKYNHDIEEYNFREFDSLKSKKQYELWEIFLKITQYDKILDDYISTCSCGVPLWDDEIIKIIPNIHKQFTQYVIKNGLFWNNGHMMYY